MFNLFKKSSEENASCCNVQIVEVKDQGTNDEDECCSSEKKEQCCSNNEHDECCSR